MGEYYPQMPEWGSDEDLPLWQPAYPPIPPYPQTVKRDWQYITITAMILAIGFVGWIAYLTLPPVLVVLVVVGTIGLCMIAYSVIRAWLL